METIFASLITGGVTLVVCLLTNASAHAKTEALLNYRLAELEKKVNKHNNVIERTYELEKRTDLQEEKIRVANHRIDDLEKKEN